MAKEEAPKKKKFDPSVLEGLGKGFARYDRIRSAVFKGLDIDPELVDEAIGFYEKVREISTAAEMAKRVGDTERAITDFVKAKSYLLAARVAKKAGDTERANALYEKQIEELRILGKRGDAAGVAEEYLGTERAIRFCDENGMYFRAAKLAEKQGDIDRALGFYEKGHLFVTAVRLAEKHGKAEKAERYKKLAEEQEKQLRSK